MTIITLEDLAAAGTVTAETSRGSIQVSALSVGQIADIISRYPDLVALLSGGTIRLSTIIERAPAAVAAIIAAACGMPGERGEAAASRISAPDTLEILAAAVEASFPGGIGNFFERLQGRIDQMTGVTAAGGAGDDEAAGEMPSHDPAAVALAD